MNIVVCDDEDAPRSDWVEAIAKIVGSNDVRQLDNQPEQLRTLLNRRYAVRKPDGIEPQIEVDWTPTQIDEADILIVDYDLTLIDKNARHTGEEVARLARMYSNCGYIIVMNQYPGIGFDLTLKGHLESYADVNIDSTLAGTRSLWLPAPENDFRPWHWDNISAITASRQQLASRLSEAGPDASLVEFIGMPEEVIDRLADTAFAFISPDTQSPNDLVNTTLSQFLSHLTEKKDLEMLLEARPENAARTAIARLSKWLSRTIVGPQDVLIDVPHLLTRLPYATNRRLPIPTTIDDWNELLLHGADAIHPELRAVGEFGTSVDWIGKPTFWWPLIERLPLIDELRDGFDYDGLPDMVFCEDASQFVPTEHTTEFRAGFHNFFDRRYVRMFDGVEYAPRRRLAFMDA